MENKNRHWEWKCNIQRYYWKYNRNLSRNLKSGNRNFLDCTSPVVIEECVNEELNDRIQNDFIEENKTWIHDEEGYISTETESATSEEVDKKHERGKRSSQ